MCVMAAVLNCMEALRAHRAVHVKRLKKCKKKSKPGWPFPWDQVPLVANLRCFRPKMNCFYQ